MKKSNYVKLFEEFTPKIESKGNEFTHEFTCDYAYDGDLLESLEDLGSKGIAVQCLEASGPGGGHPLFRLIGSKSTLESFVRNEYSTGDANADEENISDIRPI